MDLGRRWTRAGRVAPLWGGVVTPGGPLHGGALHVRAKVDPTALIQVNDCSHTRQPNTASSSRACRIAGTRLQGAPQSADHGLSRFNGPGPPEGCSGE